MKKLALLLLAVGAVFAPYAGSTTSGPNCMQMETQAWWSDMPNTHKTGHLHAEMCFPIYQTVSSPTIPLMIHWQIHDFDGSGVSIPNFWLNAEGDRHLEMRTAGVWKPNDGGMVDYQCPIEQCEGTFTFEFPVGQLAWSGWQEFDVAMQAFFPDGRSMRTLSEWWFKADNGRPPVPQSNPYWLPDNANPPTSGESWFSPEPCCGSKYARSFLAKSEVSKLWNPDTGELIPQSGDMELSAFFDKAGYQVLVDPHFHAQPVDLGTQVAAGHEQAVTFTVDTTKLDNGVHKLFIRNIYNRTSGTQSGVFVVPFLVENNAPEPTTTTPTSTTTTTTTTPDPTTTSTTTTTTTPAYHPNCEPTCDETIADLKDKLAQINELSKP